MNDVIAKMVEEDPESEDGKRKIQKLVDRDVKKLRNDVDRQVSQCKQDCPSECDSCGSAKIEELKLKLQVFIFILQGPSWQSVYFKLPLMDRNVQVRFCLKVSVYF